MESLCQCGPGTESGSGLFYKHGLWKVSVSVDQGLRVEVVYVSHTPDSGLWKVSVSVDQGLRVEVVYVSHGDELLSKNIGLNLDFLESWGPPILSFQVPCCAVKEETLANFRSA